MTTPGTLSISFEKEGRTYTLLCGTVQAVDDNIQASVSVTPIPSYDARYAFAFDTGVQEVISFTLTRRNPENAIDLPGFVKTADMTDPSLTDTQQREQWPNSNQWCNRLWKLGLQALIDRWQMRTDGCTIDFVPVISDATTGKGVYQNPISENAYLKSVSIDYDTKSHEVLRVAIVAAIGSMGRV